MWTRKSAYWVRTKKNYILNQYIESIRGQFPNTGKQIADLKSCETPKNVSILRERVQKALYGLQNRLVYSLQK